MASESVIDDTKSSLSNILACGLQQISSYEEQHPKNVVRGTHFGTIYQSSEYGLFTPTNRATITVDALVDPDAFLFQLLSSFWNFFRLLHNQIDDVLVQFAMRGLLECSYRIFWYSRLSEGEKVKLATKYWICFVGRMLCRNKDQKRQKEYENLISRLDLKEQIKFPKVFDSVARIYFHRINYKLYRSVTDQNLKKLITQQRHKLWRGFSGEDIEEFFRTLSGYVHADTLYTVNIESEQKNKKFVWRCAAIMFVASCQVIETTNEMLPDNNKVKLREIVEQIRKIVPVLYEYSRHTA